MVVCVWLVTDSVVLPVTRFSVYSTLTKVTFFSAEKGYTFYNCSLDTKCVHSMLSLCMLSITTQYFFHSCRDCVETDGNCGWCLYDFSCTGLSQDCSVAGSFVKVSNPAIAQSY